MRARVRASERERERDGYCCVTGNRQRQMRMRAYIRRCRRRENRKLKNIKANYGMRETPKTHCVNGRAAGKT